MARSVYNHCPRTHLHDYCSTIWPKSNHSRRRDTVTGQTVLPARCYHMSHLKSEATIISLIWSLVVRHTFRPCIITILGSSVPIPLKRMKAQQTAPVFSGQVPGTCQLSSLLENNNYKLRIPLSQGEGLYFELTILSTTVEVKPVQIRTPHPTLQREPGSITHFTTRRVCQHTPGEGGKPVTWKTQTRCASAWVKMAHVIK